MAVTEQDLKHFGVASDEIWKAKVKKEKLTASNWPVHWSWMLDEYRDMTGHLNDLKKLRPTEGKSKPIDMRSCKPLPDTSSRVIGWLAKQPEFQLEIYGPFIKKFPIFPPVESDS